MVFIVCLTLGNDWAESKNVIIVSDGIAELFPAY